VAGLADDEPWRDFLAVHAGGQTSTRAMSKGQLDAVIQALYRAGAPRLAPKAGGKPRYADDARMRMIRGLWITLADAEVVRDRSESALATFVRRQTGQDLGALYPSAASKVIEALKDWAKRKGVELAP
jgi:hypothetical protein